MPKRGPRKASHRIDKRAAELLASASDLPNILKPSDDRIDPWVTGSDDDLLTQVQVCQWWGVSPQFLINGRNSGDGPRYRRIAPKMIRYPLGDLKAYLEARAFISAQDERSPSAKRKKAMHDSSSAAQTKQEQAAT